MTTYFTPFLFPLVTLPLPAAAVVLEVQLTVPPEIPGAEKLLVLEVPYHAPIVESLNIVRP